MPLTTTHNLARPDEFYQALIEIHAGLDRARSEALNARLILLLANHVGDAEVLMQALQAARASLDSGSDT